MATLLTQSLRTMYRDTIRRLESDAGIYSGTVSELQVGDFLIGPRMSVIGVGTASGSPAVRPLTLKKDAITFTVSWLNTQTIYFQRA